MEPLFIIESDVGDVASCSFDELAVNLLRFLLNFETQFPSAALSHKELLSFIVGGRHMLLATEECISLLVTQNIKLYNH